MLYPTFFCSKCGRNLAEEIEHNNDTEDKCDHCKTTQQNDYSFKGIMGESNLWGRK